MFLPVSKTKDRIQCFKDRSLWNAECECKDLLPISNNWRKPNEVWKDLYACEGCGRVFFKDQGVYSGIGIDHYVPWPVMKDLRSKGIKPIKEYDLSMIGVCMPNEWKFDNL